MADYKHVMVFGELAGTGLASITKELLNGGRKLADKSRRGAPRGFPGDGIAGRAAEACAVGADRAYAVEDPKLGKYTGDLFAGSDRPGRREAGSENSAVWKFRYRRRSGAPGRIQA